MTRDWKVWVARNANNLEGFEKQFVELVLSKITLITPADVNAQYVFKDSIGKNRRVDFVISSPKGFFLAIEIDGARRGGGQARLENDEIQYQWSDFLQRQNDLLERVGPLLRFSNSQVFKKPTAVAKRIEQTLSEQLKQFVRQEALKSDIKRKESRLKELKNKIANAETEISSSERTNMQNSYNIQVEQVKATIIELEKNESQRLEYALKETSEELQNVNKKNSLMMKAMLFITAVIVVSMVVIVIKTTAPSLIPIDAENEQVKKAENRIPAYKAVFHVGKTVMVCGKLVEIKKLSNRIYLNLDKKYPSQLLTILIWENNFNRFKSKFGSLEDLLNRKVCVYGSIEEYRNNLQIEVSNEAFLRLMH